MFHDMSVRGATRYIYPFIKTRTIYNWIEEGIFTPYVNVRTPAGPGKGTRLDRIDLVTLGLLHSLFTLGLRFSHFQPRDTETPQLKIRFWHQAPSHGLLGQEGEPHFALGGRHIQEFLSKYEAKVYGYLQIYHSNRSGQEVEASVQFWPRSREDLTDSFLPLITDSRKRPRVGHVFLNIEEWANYVQQMIVFHRLG